MNTVSAEDQSLSLSVPLAPGELAVIVQVTGLAKQFLERVSPGFCANQAVSINWGELALLRQIVDTFSQAVVDQAAVHALLNKLRAPLLVRETPMGSGGDPIIISP
jgi:hypothetical protein